jgi:hypothetical protein
MGTKFQIYKICKSFENLFHKNVDILTLLTCIFKNALMVNFTVRVFTQHTHTQTSSQTH